MKYLLSWLLNHIDSKIDCSESSFEKIKKLVSNNVAEIEHSFKIENNLENFHLIKIKSIEEKFIICSSEEINDEIILPKRNDLNINDLNITFFDKNLKKYKWASTKDFGGEKENFIPALDEKNSKNWKSLFPKEDFILSIDNKSIGHRPDLWGHKGLAREIALNLNSKLKENKDFLETKEDKNFIKIESKNCNFYSVLKDLNINEKKSNIFYAIQLSKLDCKPISFLVDISNYIMFDTGHPLNVFDAEKVENYLLIRDAKKNETMSSRDNNEINFFENDLLISDSKNNVLVLAGISCGKTSAISLNTKKIHVEAAVFDKNQIRNTSKKIGIRTESSSRIEKGLNSEGALSSLNEFYSILKKEYSLNENPKILYNGKFDSIKKIEIEHSFIEKIIGSKIKEDQIIFIAKNLGFKIETENKEKIYKITVPFWRKDISIKEDFVEEISRNIGYSNIEPKEIKVEPKGYIFDTFFLKVKELCKNILNSKEVYSYGISNNVLEEKLKYFPKNTVNLKNGFSEIQHKLNSTLIPNLSEILKNKILEGEKEYSVFEISSIFEKENSSIFDKNVLSILIYTESESKYDFYEKKNIFINFFNSLNSENEIIFTKFKQKKFSFMSDLSADLSLNNGNVFGFCGFIKPDLVFDLTKKKRIDFCFRNRFKCFKNKK